MTAPPQHPYDPGDPYPDDAFDADCALLVLLASHAADPGWATKSAISLARQWADSGERVFLADLAFRKPYLHRQLGQPNGEGVSDVFLFGASLRRVARAAPEGFFFASAGTPVPDGRKVLASERWGLLTQGFSRAGAHLVVYLPVDEPGASEVLPYAGRVLLLAGSDATDVLDASRSVSDKVAGVLSPRRTYQPPTLVFETEKTRARPAGAIEAPARVTFGGLGKRSSATDKRVRQAALAGGLLLALVIVLGGIGVIPMPWSRRGEPRGGQVVPTAVQGPAGGAVGGAAAAGDSAASWFLTLDSYAERAVAEMQAQTLGQRRPDLLFIVSPVEVNGGVLYRLMVGTAPDSAAAELRASLASTLSTEDLSAKVARPGPLSFHLGSYESRQAATARVNELQGRAVPAYLLQQPDTSNPRPFDVWAGAFADEAEAAYLRATLDVQGIVPVLVRRTGELIPQAPR
jgi:hypothetical protein